MIPGSNNESKTQQMSMIMDRYKQLVALRNQTQIM